MSTSIVHLLTIVGKASLTVEATCDELLGRRVPDRRPAGYGSLDWSERDHGDIEKFCNTLVSAAYKLPVLYYSQHIDAWTVADSRFCIVKWPDGKRRQIYGNNHGLVYYPSIMAVDFEEQIANWRSTEIYRTQTEDRWYLDRLAEALKAPQWLKAPFLVVAISHALDGSRHDEEIKASLELPLRFTDVTNTS